MPSAFVLVDIFEGIDDFFNNHLSNIPEVKEKHRNHITMCHPPESKVNDYEIILRIDSPNEEGIRHSIQRIKTYGNGVKDIRVLPVVYKAQV